MADHQPDTTRHARALRMKRLLSLLTTAGTALSAAAPLCPAETPSLRRLINRTCETIRLITFQLKED